MLDQMTKRLRAHHTFEQAIGQILDDAMALNGAEYGTFQLPADDYLLIVDHRAFRQPFLDVFRKVVRHHGSACGRALTSGKTVLIEDIEQDEEFTPYRSTARAAGYRSVVTTPLLQRNRQLMGVVATHFAIVHRPTDIEITTFEQYAAVAADHLHGLLGQGTAALEDIARSMHRRLYPAATIS